MSYQSGWIPIVEFQTGQTVSDKFDAAFNSVDLGLAVITELDAKVTELSDRVGVTEQGLIVLLGRIETAESNIGSNAIAIGENSIAIGENSVAIGENASDINDNATAIGENVVAINNNSAAISINAGNIALLQPIYEYEKSINVTILETWTDIGELDIATNPYAIYEYKFAVAFSLDSIVNSALFRYSIDGGVTWTNAQIEPSDVLNEYNVSYFFPKEVAENAGLKFIMQAMKESNGDTMIVSFADVVIEKKKNL